MIRVRWPKVCWFVWVWGLFQECIFLRDRLLQALCFRLWIGPLHQTNCEVLEAIEVIREDCGPCSWVFLFVFVKDGGFPVSPESCFLVRSSFDSMETINCLNRRQALTSSGAYWLALWSHSVVQLTIRTGLIFATPLFRALLCYFVWFRMRKNSWTDHQPSCIWRLPPKW